MVNGVPTRGDKSPMSAQDAAAYRAAITKHDYNDPYWDGQHHEFDEALTQPEMDQYKADYRNGGGSFMSDLFDGVKQLAVPAALAGLAIASGGASAGFMSSLGSAIPEIGSVMAGGEAAAGGAAALGEGAAGATVADAATTAASNAAFGSSFAGYAGAGAAGGAAAGEGLAGGGAGGADALGSFDPATAAANTPAYPYAPPTNALPAGYSAPGAAGAAGAAGSTSTLGSMFAGAKTGMSALSALMGGNGAMGPALGAIGSGLLSANGANTAAQTQANSATQAINMQQGMFDKSQQNLQPFMAGGAQAMGELNGKLADGSLGGTFTGADYLANKDPGYEFQLNQGNQALQNSQAARDGVLGGSSLKGLIDYNQGVASTGYQSAYQRWMSSQQNTYGQLFGAAGIGATAAGAGASNASRFGDSIGGNITGRGNSLAAGQVGQSNALSQAVSGIGNQMYALRDMLPGNSSYDTGSNGQNNPTNQQGLDTLISKYTD